MVDEQIAELVARVSGRERATTSEQIVDQLRRVEVEQYSARRRIENLEAERDALREEAHRIRNTDAGLLAAADLAALDLRSGIRQALGALADGDPGHAGAVLRAVLDGNRASPDALDPA
jgi:chromosome segregation ATPase